jgi:hypothetical protein
MQVLQNFNAGCAYNNHLLDTVCKYSSRVIYHSTLQCLCWYLFNDVDSTSDCINV